MTAFPTLSREIEKDSGVEPEPNILKAPFGDGYEQRAAAGLNNVRDVYDCRISLETSETNTLIEFFRARGGYQAIEWTPPGETTERKFVCEKWKKIYSGPTWQTIAFTMREIFDL
jgi:phage-related protein